MSTGTSSIAASLAEAGASSTGASSTGASSTGASSTGASSQRKALSVAAADLFAIIGGGKAGRALAAQLAREGMRTRADLRRAAVLARLPRAARAAVLFAPRRAVPGPVAAEVAAAVLRQIKIAGPVVEVIPVGSVRRGAPTAKDIDFLVVVRRPADTDSALASLQWRPGAVSIADTYAAGRRRRSCILEYSGAHYRSDFFVCPESERAFALMHYTGPALYNIRLRARAKAAGHRLNQYGIFSIASGRRLRGSAAIRTEEELAAFLGVTARLPARR